MPKNRKEKVLIAAAGWQKWLSRRRECFGRRADDNFEASFVDESIDELVSEPGSGQRGSKGSGVNVWTRKSSMRQAYRTSVGKMVRKTQFALNEAM